MLSCLIKMVPASLPSAKFSFKKEVKSEERGQVLEPVPFLVSEKIIIRCPVV